MKYLLQNISCSDMIYREECKRRRLKMAGNKTKVLVTKEQWCKGCGICVSFCPKKVLTLEHQKIKIKNPDDCIQCGLCEMRCPDYAIYLEEK